jgi:hypothetical protein
MRILVDVVDPLRVERGSAALDAVDFIAFFQQKLRQVGAVLAGHASYQCFFHPYLLKFSGLNDGRLDDEAD